MTSLSHIKKEEMVHLSVSSLQYFARLLGHFDKGLQEPRLLSCRDRYITLQQVSLDGVIETESWYAFSTSSFIRFEHQILFQHSIIAPKSMTSPTEVVPYKLSRRTINKASLPPQRTGGSRTVVALRAWPAARSSHSDVFDYGFH